MRTKVGSAIIILSASIADIRAELVTSSIKFNAEPTPVTATAAAGPVEDQRSEAVGGIIASSSTGTKGISYVTIPKYPNYVFVNTGAFSANSTARVSVVDSGTAKADTEVRRDGRWFFDAISPNLVGTGGSFKMTFIVSETARFSAGDDSISTQTSLHFWKTNYSIVTVASIDRNGTSGGIQTNTQVYTTAPIPFSRFGEAFDFYWRMRCFAGSTRFDRESSNSSMIDLWKLTVFDANGNELTRFVDYDWFEIVSDPSGAFNALRMASGEMIGPTVQINRAESGNPEISYTGILQESPDLGSWHDVIPQPNWRSEQTTTPTSMKFFRSRTP